MEKKSIYFKRIAISVSTLSCVILVLVLLYVFVFASEHSKLVLAGPKLVIDHDGGADDAMAIFLALIYEENFDGPKVVGLTTIHGNVDEEQVFNNSQKILDIANRRDVPIFRGSTTALVKSPLSDFYFGRDGLGDLHDVVYEPIQAQPGHAVNALIEMSKKYEGELIVAVIGSVTNIALATKLDPLFISRLQHLYIAAGNIYSQKHPDPEFNALHDVEAYYIVAENSIRDKVTFIPFSPFFDLHNISMEWRVNVLGAIDTPIMQAQKKFERLTSYKATWSHLDPQAMAMILNNNLIGKESCSNNSIILCGAQRGVNTNNFTDCNYSNAKIAFAGPDEDFKKYIYDVFSSQL